MKRFNFAFAVNLVTAVGFMAAISLSCGGKKQESGPGNSAVEQSPAENQAAPVASSKPEPSGGQPPGLNFTLSDLNGRSVSLSDYKGKVVLVDFWATWCGPCRQEIPHLKKLYAENKDRGFEILAVAMDENGSSGVPPFAKANQLPYPVLLGTPEVEELFGGIFGYPTTYLFDRNGSIVDKALGYRPKEYFESKLKPLLEGSS